MVRRIAAAFALLIAVVNPGSCEEPSTAEVWIQGVALDSMVGPCIMEPSGCLVFIDGLHEWPDGFYEGGSKGKTVVSKGQIVERYDLPVYEAKPGEPPRSGVPVPPGTDMHKAKRRFLMIWSEWDEWRISSDPFRGYKPVDVSYSEDSGLTIKGPISAPALAVFHVSVSTPVKKLKELVKELTDKGFGRIKMDFLADPKGE